MNESKLLAQIFGKEEPHGPENLTKIVVINSNTYNEVYCELCGCFRIAGCTTKDCHGSSCNGGGCSICVPDHNEYNQSANRCKTRMGV